MLLFIEFFFRHIHDKPERIACFSGTRQNRLELKKGGYEPLIYDHTITMNALTEVEVRVELVASLQG
jgi:hypothetical protein